jgi:uncharacterized Ntn-hydrolase superfamily protein
MTWSIIALDAETGRVGIAVATRFFAVGAMVPHIQSGVGAVATQAFVNPMLGPRALDAMARGADAAAALATIIEGDDGRAVRQVHLMDRQGGTARYTGGACVDWCGHRGKIGLSVAGNMLAGADVIDATVATYEASGDLAFAQRLIAAMKAGEAAGGDKRGRQSAALLVHDAEDYALLDLRVDDHPDPLTELSRLEAVSHERWLHFRRLMPRRDDPVGCIDRSGVDDFIQRSVAEGYQ